MKQTATIVISQDEGSEDVEVVCTFDPEIVVDEEASAVTELAVVAMQALKEYSQQHSGSVDVEVE